MNALRHKHPRETCWIVGKGPSLRYLRAEHFGDGPVIAINTAIVDVQDLGLSNSLYLLEKDGVLGDFTELHKDVTLILQVGFSEERFPHHHKRVLVDPVAEMGFLDTEMSCRMAVVIARAMGCAKIIFVCCDSLTSEEYRCWEDDQLVTDRVGAYKRVKPLILKDVANFPHNFVVPEKKND